MLLDFAADSLVLLPSFPLALLAAVLDGLAPAAGQGTRGFGTRAARTQDVGLGSEELYIPSWWERGRIRRIEDSN